MPTKKVEIKKTTITRRKLRRKLSNASVIKAFSSKINKKKLAILLVFIILAGILYYFRGQFIIATVNGRPISRLALIKELENQAGKRTLESLIAKTLIIQEAKRQKIAVSDDEINQRINQIEESFSGQGQSLDQMLELQGMSRDELIKEIKMQIIAEKIAGKDIEVTDEEVNNYLEENKGFIPKDSNVEEIKTGVKQQLEQQKINEKIQSWIQSLRDNAKINYLLKL